MADEPRFTHITVSVDDDDDFVIQAGSASVPVEPVAPAEELAPAEEHARAAEEPASAKEPAPASAPVSAGKRRSDAQGYRETTLEDLEAAKMSSMQKGVIVAAIVAIVAFVMWYVL